MENGEIGSGSKIVGLPCARKTSGGSRGSDEGATRVPVREL